MILTNEEFADLVDRLRFTELVDERTALDNLCALARDELLEMRKLIDRLPKTADGVPILPGQEVWTWFPDEPGPEQVMVTRTGACGVYQGCYSNREAAEKAGKP